MIDDQIRKYVRATIDDSDSIDINITRIATNQREALVNPIPVTPVNISAKGIKFSSELSFTTGIMVDLKIRIEDKQIKTTGKIVRKEEIDGEYTYAVTYSLMKEYNMVIISSFVKRKTIDHIQNLRGQ